MMLEWHVIFWLGALNDHYMETYIRGLETLNQIEECYGNLLVPVVLRKLPSKIRQNLARTHGGDDWTLGDLRKAIGHELSIPEAVSHR